MKLPLPRVIANSLFAGVLLSSIAAPAHADTVVVTADRMIDVLAGRIVDRPQDTIVDGRITAVAVGNSAVPAGARQIDLKGMTLLPGLIDMHTHLTSDPRYGGYRGLEFTDNFWTVVGVAKGCSISADETRRDVDGKPENRRVEEK